MRRAWLLFAVLAAAGCETPACMDRRCLRGHMEVRHHPAWTELRAHYCGENCTMFLPIYHQAYNADVYVCDVRETDYERDNRRAKAKGLNPEKGS